MPAAGEGVHAPVRRDATGQVRPLHAVVDGVADSNRASRGSNPPSIRPVREATLVSAATAGRPALPSPFRLHRVRAATPGAAWVAGSVAEPVRGAIAQRHAIVGRRQRRVHKTVETGLLDSRVGLQPRAAGGPAFTYGRRHDHSIKNPVRPRRPMPAERRISQALHGNPGSDDGPPPVAVPPKSPQLMGHSCVFTLFLSWVAGHSLSDDPVRPAKDSADTATG